MEKGLLQIKGDNFRQSLENHLNEIQSDSATAIEDADDY